jgi:hypothetical protein
VYVVEFALVIDRVIDAGKTVFGLLDLLNE